MIERINNILNLLKKKQSLLILGPRGTGKSYFINKLLDTGALGEHIKINLLYSEDYRVYLNNPSHLAKQVRALVSKATRSAYVFIDEIQLIPELLNEVHALIEELGPKAVFILTGSSARKLKRGDVNLLAGRAALINFFPISSLEYDFELYFDQIIKYGTLPKIINEADSEIVEAYLNTYTHTYLKEEIQQEALVRNLPAFARFLELAAQHNGQPINCSKIAKLLGVSANTIASYYSILEETLIAAAIPSWTHSVKHQLQQSPRYYFFDHGIVRTLCGELRSELTSSSFRFGAMFEALVVNELIKAMSINNSPLKLYSFRNRSNKEIDLVLQSGPFATPIGVEIKSATAPTASDVRHLKLLKEENSNAKLVVLCRCKYPYEDAGILFEPFLSGIKKIALGEFGT
jgi:predicted AAA+ superfamily ATPase